MSAKRLLSISQAAKLLQISPDTLRNWEVSGKLVPERTAGGARRYSLSELTEFKKELPVKSGHYYLSVSKAAKSLNISSDTLRNWQNRGLIEAQRSQGGARRFSRAEIKRIQKELGVEKVDDVVSPIDTNPVIEPNIPTFEPKYSHPVSLESGFKRKTLFNFMFLLCLVGLLIGLNVYLAPDSFHKELETQKKEFDEKIGKLSGNLESLQNQLYKIDDAKAKEDSEVLGIESEVSNPIEQVLPEFTLDNEGNFVTPKLKTDKLTLGKVDLAGFNLEIDNDIEAVQNNLNSFKSQLDSQDSKLNSQVSALDSLKSQVQDLITKSEATSSSVLVADFKVVANKISGRGEIPANEKSIDVPASLITDKSRVLVTPTSDIDGVLAVTTKTPGVGFKVSNSKVATESAFFDWWMVTEVD